MISGALSNSFRDGEIRCHTLAASQTSMAAWQ